MRLASLIAVSVAGAALVAGVWLLDGGDGGSSTEPLEDAYVAGVEASVPGTDLGVRLGGDAAPRATTARGGVLVGRVTRAGAPLAAQVSAWMVETLPPGARLAPRTTGSWRRRMEPVAWPPAAARGAAGADGRFRLERLARGQVIVLAKADDGVQAWVGARLAGTGDTVEVQLEVPPPGGPLHGRVRYADGHPWRGLVRRVAGGDGLPGAIQRPEEPPPVATDEKGAFSLLNGPAGGSWVHAFLPGEIDVYAELVTCPRSEPVEIVIDANLAWIPGRVVSDEDGAPIPGAIAVGTVGSATVRSLAGPDGSIRIAKPLGTAAGAYDVFAEGFTNVSVAVDAAAEELVVALSKSGRVSVRARTGRGLPVSGATVEVVGGSASGAPLVGVTGGDGRCDLADVPSGVVSLTLRSERWWSGPTQVTVPRGGEASVEVVMRPTATLVGQVLDPEGRGVRGAHLDVLEWSESGGWSPPVVQSQCDEEGRFALRGLSTSVAQVVEITSPGFLRHRSTWFKPADPIELDGTPPPFERASVFRLERGRRLEARVQDEAGGPVEGVAVSAGDEQGVVGSSRVDLQACKLEYSIVSPK